MFKLTVPIVKSVRRENGKLLVEGIASDPSIDRDEERFDPSAILKMKECVNKGNLPIRVEHEDKIYTDIGKWISADVVNDRLVVKGEVDTELSLGKDIEVLLKRGLTLALSVCGTVVDAAYEYSKELNKKIKVYKDVMLSEISIIKHPSNKSVSLSMAKTIDWEKLKTAFETERKLVFTEEAKELDTIAKEYKKVSEEEFIKKPLTTAERNALPDSAFAYVEEVDGKKIRKLPIHDPVRVRNALAVIGGAMGGVEGISAAKMKAVKAKIEAAAKKFKIGDYAEKSVIGEQDTKVWAENAMKKALKVFKEYDEVEEATEVAQTEKSLDMEDLKALGMLMTVMNEIKLPEKMPTLLEDDDYWQNITEEHQVVLWDRMMCKPHHNLDYSVNGELLLWQLKTLVDGQNFYTPKDFQIILTHLYKHLKEFNMVKKNKKASKAEVVVKASEQEIALFESCYKYLKGETKETPIYNDKTLTAMQVKKCANLYEQLLTNPEHMKKTEEKATEEVIEKTEAVTEEKTEEVVEEKAEEVVETPAEEVVEEVVEEKKEEVVEEVAEEVVAEVPVEEAPVEEKKEEEVAEEVVEEKIEEEKVEEVVEEKEEEAEKSEKKPELVNSFSKAEFNKLEKSVDKLATVVTSLVEKAEKVTGLEATITEMQKTITTQAELLSEVAKRSAGRKSIASYQILEKTFAVSGEVSDTQKEAIKKMEEGLSFTEAYKISRA